MNPEFLLSAIIFLPTFGALLLALLFDSKNAEAMRLFALIGQTLDLVELYLRDQPLNASLCVFWCIWLSVVNQVPHLQYLRFQIIRPRIFLEW